MREYDYLEARAIVSRFAHNSYGTKVLIVDNTIPNNAYIRPGA